MHDIEEMRTTYQKSGKKDMAFANMQIREEETSIRLYVWSKKFEQEYECFLLSSSYLMPMKEFELFTALCKKKRIYMNQQEIQEIFNRYYLEHPEIHLRPYKSGMHMLHHIYCALHPGIEELLYKADLGFLALHLNEIDDYNMIGTNPSAVFDGLPIYVLRAMNTAHGVQAIRTEKMRKWIYSLYMKENQLFQRTWSLSQCEYFKNDICEREEEGFFWEDSRKLEYLSCHSTRKDYVRLSNYDKKVKALKGIAVLPAVPVNYGRSYEDYFYKADFLYDSLVQEKVKWNVSYIFWFFKRGMDLEYEAGDYLIRFPKNPYEIYKESEKQHSCLWTYIKKVGEGETTILFMRKKENPEEAFITIEVYESIILQARGRYNEMISEKEMEWVEKYAQEKGLICIREEWF